MYEVASEYLHDGMALVSNERAVLRAKRLTDGSYVYNVEVKTDPLPHERDEDDAAYPEWIELCAVDLPHAERIWEAVADCVSVR